MSDWHDLLKQRGAQIRDDHIHSFGEQPNDYPSLLAEHTLLFALNQVGALRLRDGALAGGAKNCCRGS